MLNYKEAARNFIENEKQFHLGVIPTEQPNPKTKNLSFVIWIPPRESDDFIGRQRNRCRIRLLNTVQRLISTSNGQSTKEEPFFSQASVLRAVWLCNLMRRGDISGLPSFKTTGQRKEFLKSAKSQQSYNWRRPRFSKICGNFEDYMTFGVTDYRRESRTL